MVAFLSDCGMGFGHTLALTYLQHIPQSYSIPWSKYV